jgi:adenylate cyclase
VIGTRFSSKMLEDLNIEPSLDELVGGELVDQVEFTPRAGYAFRHPLIRAVAYESQLKSVRAQLHRRVAATIGQHDQNAALIAEHLEAAGDLRDAYEWHMRAAAWSANRDIAAAQLSWERASQVADVLPTDPPDRLAMRIAPRTLLCGSAWRRFHEDVSTRFEELRELCTEAGDKASLAIGMAGLVLEHVLRARITEASRLASEYMALVESIADPTLTAGLSFAACVAKLQAAEWADVLRWTQTVIGLADGDPAMAGFIIGSPLATALAFRGYARWCVGRSGWREDLDRAVAMARTTDPVSHATVVAYKYVAIAAGVLLADDAAMTDIDEAMQVAERSSDDIALVLVRLAQGIALVNRDSADRQRGLEVLARLRATCVEERFALNVVPAFDLYAAQEQAAHGDLDGAIRQLRPVLDATVNSGNVANVGAITAGLVEMLLARGAEADLAEAETAIEMLANAMRGNAGRDITVLRLRVLLAKSRGDEQAYRELKERYRAMATSLGFEGHRAWAEAMS